jgi:DNA-binding MarR family transcriptional regulator
MRNPVQKATPMPTHVDKSRGSDEKSSTDHSVPAGPNSFSPHVSDSAAPNAWESLRSLSEPAPRGAVSADDLLALARSTIDARNLRRAHLPAPIFGEPAWNMLLLLYVSSGSGTKESVSMLSLSSGAAATTALRWIDYLVREELVMRQPNRHDLRVVHVELTDKGRGAIEAYLVDLLAQRAASAETF